MGIKAESMGIVRRQSAFATIYSYLGVVVGFVSTGLLMPNVLSPAENGVLKLLVSYALLAGQFGVLGFKKVISRRFPYYRNLEKEHYGFFFFVVVIFFAGALLSAGALLLFKPYILNQADKGGDLFNQFYFYLIPLAWFHTMFLLLDFYLTILANITKTIFFKELLQRLLILAALGLFMLDVVDFSGFVLLYSIAYSIKAALTFGVLMQSGHVFFRPQLQYINRNTLRSMGRMMVFGMLGGFASIITFQIDSIMVSKMVGLEATGIYAITFFFGTLIQMPQRSLQKINIPFVMDAFKQGDYKQLAQLNHRTSINLMTIGALLVIGLWGNIHNVLHILPEIYARGKYVILFISLSNLVLLSSGLTGRIVALSEFYAYQTLFVLAHAVLIVTTNWLFIPVFGLEGAALASLVSMIVIISVRLLFLWRHFFIQPFTKRHLGVALAGILAYGASLLLPELPYLLLDIVVRSLLIIAVYAPLVYWFNLAPDLNAFAKQILQRIMKILKF